MLEKWKEKVFVTENEMKNEDFKKKKKKRNRVVEASINYQRIHFGLVHTPQTQTFPIY